MPVPERVAGERSRELRQLVQAKGEVYAAGRAGTPARAVIESPRSALTGDYLRVAVAPELADRVGELTEGRLQGDPDGLYIGAPASSASSVPA
jgi:tRNA A37 methylthiotransferase MiaB